MNRVAVEKALWEIAKTSDPNNLRQRKIREEDIEMAVLTPNCGSQQPPRYYWKDYPCEVFDLLLQTTLIAKQNGASPCVVEFEYLNDQTNVIDRKFKSFEWYRNPEVGQSCHCLWDCVADQLTRRGGLTLEGATVKSKCVAWMTANENYTMPEDCSLPHSQNVRCTLGQYCEAAYDMSWQRYVESIAQEDGWGDVLCLFAIVEVFQCSLVVCSKLFPYADFFVRLGEDHGPELLLGHWDCVQFRSIITRGNLLFLIRYLVGFSNLPFSFV